MCTSVMRELRWSENGNRGRVSVLVQIPTAVTPVQTCKHYPRRSATYLLRAPAGYDYPSVCTEYDIQISSQEFLLRRLRGRHHE